MLSDLSTSCLSFQILPLTNATFQMELAVLTKFRILAIAGKSSVWQRRIFLPLLNPSTELNGRVQGGRHSIHQLQVSVQRASWAACWKAHREICVSLPSNDISLCWRGRGMLGVSDRKPKHYLHLSRNFDLHRWRQQVSTRTLSSQTFNLLRDLKEQVCTVSPLF